jgi:hypothetical protein
MPYLTLQEMFNPSFPPGWWYYFRSCDVAELNDDIVDVMVQYGEQIDSPITALGVWQTGGAGSRVSDDDTAFNGRTAGHTFNIGGNTMTADGFEAERDWVHRFWTALQPYHTSVYVNFPHGRGARAGPAGIRISEVRPPADTQTEVRSQQLLPTEPEHPARLRVIRGPALRLARVPRHRRSGHG